MSRVRRAKRFLDSGGGQGEAIKATPLYKVFYKLGFTNVSFFPFFPGGEVVFRKP